jgi:hypothetical protein
MVEIIFTNLLAKIVNEIKNGTNKKDNIMGYHKCNKCSY